MVGYWKSKVDRKRRYDSYKKTQQALIFMSHSKSSGAVIALPLTTDVACKKNLRLKRVENKNSGRFELPVIYQ